MGTFNIKWKNWTVVFFIYTLLLLYQNLYLERNQTEVLFTFFAGLILCYFYLKQHIRSVREPQLYYFILLLFFVNLTPFSPLSNDYYRFLWDGKIIQLGYNPYEFTPEECMQTAQFYSSRYFKTLFHGMGDLSAKNYSCYPIFSQFYFWLSTRFSTNITVQLITLKSLIIFSLTIGLYYLKLLLNQLKIQQYNVFFLILHPLFILEAIQNVHLEGVMFLCVTSACYFILNQRFIIGSLFLSCAIQLKLIPLLLFLYFFRLIGIQRTLYLGILTLTFNLILSLIFIDLGTFPHFIKSLGLYFNNFEFNSSVYFVVQWITEKRYSTSIGGILSIFTIFILIYLAYLQEKNNWISFFKTLTLAFTTYYIFASTVHPWYLILPIGFSIFTSFTYTYIWGGMALFSYVYYAYPKMSEISLIYRCVSYIVLLIILIYELNIMYKKTRLTKKSLPV